MSNKLRMRQGKFMAIWIPVAALLFILCLVVTIVLNTIPKTMDMNFGKGQRHVDNVKGTENWDLEYYKQAETDSKASEANAEKVCLEIAGEGSVLLKNNGVLPLAKNSTVTPFGFGYLNPQYSNLSGEYNSAVKVTPADGLQSYFQVNDAAVKKMKAAKCDTIGPAEGTLSGVVNALETDINLYDYDVSVYAGIEAAVKDTMGIVFVTRKLGEGFDEKYDGYEDGTPHYLALTADEKEAVRFAKKHCGAVTVVINSGNVMELTPLLGGEYEADAIVWVGLSGSVGFSALGGLLAGEADPSGRTADIWAADFTKDPTYGNFGEFQYTNADFDPQGYEAMTGMVSTSMNHNFINYDEGVYIGYRYYETAAALDADFVYGELDGKGGVKTAGAVAYPFGYGLSYTKFTQRIKSFSDAQDEIKVTVAVENVGGRDGKDTVQLYYTPPYTDFDRTNKIEKPAAVLAAFAKTEMIKAGDGAEVTLSFSKEDMASYCYTHDNGNGTRGCYVLESGKYEISLRADSHTALETRETEISETKWFDGRDDAHIRRSDKAAQSATDDEGNDLGFPADKGREADAAYRPAVNRFGECSDYMNRDTRLLTRRDWQGTFPAPVARRTAASETVRVSVNEMFSFDPLTDKELGNVEGSKVYAESAPAAGADNGLSIIDMRGKDYFDDGWDLLLDQINYERDQKQIESLLYNVNYATSGFDTLGMPETVAYDGPNGFRPKNSGNYAAIYPCAPIVAATWNTGLIYRLGAACGQEALTVNADVLYGIGINTHRSPFGGRNGEYYSEDGLLAGKAAAAFVSGAGDQGLICHIKHFALNDEETNRQFYLHTWADEQTIREIYLRPFEICVKEAMMTVKYIADKEGTVAHKKMRAATAVMASQNCIGSVINFANYGLLTEVLRGEWGFKGTVITDMYTFMFATERSNKTWIKDYSIRAGSDLYLTFSMAAMGTDYGASDYDSATARSVVRNALHNWAYTMANSAIVNGAAPGAVIYYDMSLWAVLLLIANIVIDAFVILIAVMIVLRAFDTKKHPEKYKSKKQA